MDGVVERKRSEVAAAARAAGLCVEDGAPGAQILRFADQLNGDELKLLELPHSVLGALREGERWVTQHGLTHTKIDKNVFAVFATTSLSHHLC